MTSRITLVTGVFGAVASAVTAGVYIDFSARMMPSLRRMADAAGVAKMQHLNRNIEQGPFMLCFCGAGLAGGYLLYRLLRGDRATSDWLLAAGGAAYLTGLLLTMVYNVPLNNRLAAADPHAASTVDMWRDFLQNWTTANTVRAVLSVIGVGLLVAGLMIEARGRTHPPVGTPTPVSGSVAGRVSR